MMQLIDTVGNDTGPLFGINDLRRFRMVVDYDENKVMFKDKPDVWYQLPCTKRGLMLIPLHRKPVNAMVGRLTILHLRNHRRTK